MKLLLSGHDYKYAVEQVLLTLFAGERPVYVTGLECAEPEPFAVSELVVEDGKAVCNTEIFYSGKCGKHSEVRPGLLPEDKLLRTRKLQKTVKLSFYKAAMQVRGGSDPPWGALTGIRPAKILSRYTEEYGVSFREGAKYLQDEYFVSPERSALCASVAESAYELKKTLSPDEISLYIGIPFCPTRCLYCSFVSNSVEKSAKLLEPYLAALKLELNSVSTLVERLGLKLRTVYIGGGTPTTLSAVQLDELMQTVRDSFDFSHLSEYSVEAGRPDTITREKLLAIRAGGADRVSINPQSMKDEVLRTIGRAHSAEQVLKSYNIAREIGFEHINMDLIAGLPSDNVLGFAYSLERIADLVPENVTVHTLSIKRGSKLNETGAELPGGEAVSEMLHTAAALLRGASYKPYYLYRQKYSSGGFENTGWALTGHDSVYNICIMEELQSIISVGAGGVTKLVDTLRGRIERVFNKKYPLEYIRSIEESIAKKTQIAELLTKIKE